MSQCHLSYKHNNHCRYFQLSSGLSSLNILRMHTLHIHRASVTSHWTRGHHRSPRMEITFKAWTNECLVMIFHYWNIYWWDTCTSHVKEDDATGKEVARRGGHWRWSTRSAGGGEIVSCAREHLSLWRLLVTCVSATTITICTHHAQHTPAAMHQQWHDESINFGETVGCYRCPCPVVRYTFIFDFITRKKEKTGSMERNVW